MLHNTKGLVIRYLKYSETSVIATIYTELFGMQSYFLNGVRSKKSKIKINALQPLSFLDLVVYHKEKKNLNRIKELKLHPYQSIPNNIYKTSLVLFIAEIIQKSIKEEEKNLSLKKLSAKKKQKACVLTLILGAILFITSSMSRNQIKLEKNLND